MQRDSKPGLLELLPALPADRLPAGSIEGILARGHISIERLSWDLVDNEIDLVLRSQTSQTVLLKSPEAIDGIQVVRGKAKTTRASRGDDWRNLSLPKGEEVFLRVRLQGG